MYIIENLKVGATMVVISTDGTWRVEIDSINNYEFGGDSRHLVFKKSTDELFIMDLRNQDISELGKVASFKIAKEGRWIAYQLKTSEKELVLSDLDLPKYYHYLDVEGYEFCSHGNGMIIQTQLENGVLPGSELSWIDFKDGKSLEFWRGSHANHIAFDELGLKLAFFASIHKNDQLVTSIWYYEHGMSKAQLIVDSSTSGMNGMVIEADILFFSNDGNNLFFKLKNQPQPDFVASATSAKVTVYSYRDHQLRFIKGQVPYLTVLHLDDRSKVIPLEISGDVDRYILPIGNVKNYVFVISNTLAGTVRQQRDQDERYDLYLVSTTNGLRLLLKKHFSFSDLQFSPGGRYAIWFDKELKNWYAYDVKLRKIWNMTGSISTPLAFEITTPAHIATPFGIEGWLNQDSAVYIRDDRDIWRVDPHGILPAISITNKYGAVHNIEFRNLDFNKDRFNSSNDRPSLIHTGDTLFLLAFDHTTKENGFFSLIVSPIQASPKKLIMEPRMYCYDNILGFLSAGQLFPIKAENVNLYIVQRMSEKEYPNLYLTNNFRQFKAITHIEPQRKYNWYTSELIHWKLFDGTKTDGLLYKPEDFNPRKKYPVIFYYYEVASSALHYFIHPQLSIGIMDIPWFVSNGYIVCVPDIHYKNGYPGKSAFDSVISMAREISKYPWVDKQHMGLQGHSFGGFETNYIVSHTSIFAAAAPAAGIADMMSIYGERQFYFETGQGRIGTPLWMRPGLYIENSALFRANRVTTPLLIMHNRRDPIVPFYQEQNWYKVLERVGKRVWLLSYDGEGHQINNRVNKLDYSIRLSQFFNYYLKRLPPPKMDDRR